MCRTHLAFEMIERENRRKNIFIRGIRTVGRGRKKEVREVLKNKLAIDIYIKKLRTVGEGLVVELYAIENKVEIMRRKGELKGPGIWIEDNLTETEKQMQEWLESLAEEEKEKRLEARLGCMKIEVEGSWYVWNEKVGRLLEKVFRRGGEQERD